MSAALARRDGNLTAAARDLGVPRSTMIGMAARARAGNVAASGSGDEREVEYASDRPIKTEAEAVAAAEVDLTRWYVHRWECTPWGVTMKVNPGVDDKGRKKPDRVVQKTNWRVRLYLRLIAPRGVLDALEALPLRLAKGAPNRPPPADAKGKGEACVVVMGLHDAHFGKYAWAAETGDDYDLDIADRVWRDAVAELIEEARSRARTVAEVVFPVGSDFLHIDNNDSATNRGTRVDSDGRLAKVLEVAAAAFVWAVEEAAAVGRVYVPWVGGNHDRVTSLQLAREVKAWFRRSGHVEVDVSPRPRKYRRFGCNLIGLTHGDQGKPARLPGLMATENLQNMAGVTCREFHTGHLHKRAVETIDGVVLRTLPSLSGCDAYHAAEGWVGSPRAAEAYLYGERSGYRGHWVATARG